MRTNNLSSEINEISNQNVLKDIISGDFDFTVRARAFENPNLDDEEFIMNTALNDVYESVRLQAVKNTNFTNQNALISIAINDLYYLVRLEAVKKIDDEDALVHIFHNDSVESVKIQACMRLKSIKPDSLYLISDDDVLSIDDCQTLKKIAQKAVFSQSRIQALSQIHDTEFLYHFILHEIDETIASGAVENITDENILTDIALNEIHDSVRIEAIGNPNFKDRSVLEDLALNDDNHEIRKAAVSNPNLDDDALFERIAKKDCDFNVRFAAKARIQKD
jgi:hypothetical protein